VKDLKGDEELKEKRGRDFSRVQTGSRLEGGGEEGESLHTAKNLRRYSCPALKRKKEGDLQGGKGRSHHGGAIT